MLHMCSHEIKLCVVRGETFNNFWSLPSYKVPCCWNDVILGVSEDGLNTVFVFGVNVVFDADDDGIVNCDDGRYELEYFKWNFRLEEKKIYHYKTFKTMVIKKYYNIRNIWVSFDFWFLSPYLYTCYGTTIR